MKGNLLLLLFLSILLSRCSNMEKAKDVEKKLPQIVDYNLHIKPILSDRCYACHGPDKNAIKANLTFINKESAYSELSENPGHYAIVPGNKDSSEMVTRIYSTDPEIKMPPPESNLVLNDYERKLLAKWIEQGAEFKPHWSFIVPEEHKLPEPRGKEWSTNEIDQFVLAKMESMGLSPEKEASKETLIRRVTFDLTGLPPSIEDIDNFLADTSEDSYEKVVDRLLKSTTYAENMTSKWLDIARYSDSHGYQVDFYRSMWPWRDWVIKAYDNNMPFDEFITLQMAGDLMPEANYEQKLATGFNRNHSINQEGGIVREEFRVEYVADRTNTLGAAVLGLTLECARCHDHKYDPISQKNYYQLYGFFNSVPERGGLGGKAPGPSVTYPEDSLEFYRSKLRNIKNSELNKLKNRKDELNETARTDTDFINWISAKNANTNVNKKLKLEPKAYYSFNDIDSLSYLIPYDKSKSTDKKVTPNPKAGKYASGLFTDYGYNYPLGKTPVIDSNNPFTVSFWYFKNYYLSREKILSQVDEKTGKGFHIESNFKIINVRLMDSKESSMVLTAEDQINDREWVQITISYDGSGNSTGWSMYANGEKINLLADEVRDINSFASKKPFVLGLTGLASSGIDELYIFDKVLSESEINELSEYNPLAGLINDEFQALDQEQQRILVDHYLFNYDKGFKTALRNIEAVEYKYLDIPKEGELKVMTMADMEEPAETYILQRGAYDAPGEQVRPGTPESILAFSDSLPQNRLGLSKWLFNPKNPLTARVAVNRYWQYIFGRGIVETMEDFGNQGSFPSHPELLDWLAINFIESSWDIKATLKLMVMSSTYKQSSAASVEKRSKDPDNIYYARGMRYRMTIENIRDQALAVSGLLNENVGGPGVRPYQPENLWRSVTAVGGGPLSSYVLDVSEDHYRRSLYTFWKRTVPPPAMLTFDASTRDKCEVRRLKTNTPLQALVLLNDPQFMEAARVMAQNNFKDDLDIEEQIELSFRKLTGRLPEKQELDMLLSIYNDSYETYTKKPENARELLKIGDYSGYTDMDQVKLAAMTVTNSTLLNLDETITKE